MTEDQTKHDPTEWREVYSTNPGDYYAHTISVSPDGSIKLSAGGKVCVRKDIATIVLSLWTVDIGNQFVELIESVRSFRDSAASRPVEERE